MPEPRFSFLTADRPEAPECPEKLELSFDQEADAFLAALDDIYEVWEGDPDDYGKVSSPKIEAFRRLCSDFTRPYRQGERSFEALIENPDTAPKMLEVMREMYLCYKGKVDRREWSEREIDMNSTPDFLSWEITTTLDALDAQLARSHVSIDEKRRVKNNIFYVVSQALDTADELNRKKLTQWLARHQSDIIDLDHPQNIVFERDGEEYEDVTPHTAKMNIVARVEDDALARTIVQAQAQHGISLSGQERETQFRLASSILDTARPSDEHLAKRKALVATELVSCFGLDEKIVNKWRKAKINKSVGTDEEDIYYESYGLNFWELYFLEQQSPGTGKKLFETFGIANFARYDMKMLLRQLEMVDRDAPYGVVMYPETDWNGAFFHNDRQLYEASKQLQGGGYETRIVEAGSQRELARRLLRLHKKYAPAGNKFSFAIIGGHGTPNSIALGNDKTPPSFNFDKTDEENHRELEMWQSIQTDSGSFETGDLEGEGINRALQDWFEEGAPKVFVSCSTGVEGGIAERASVQTSGEVIAPKTPTNVRRIDVSFDTNGRPVFAVEYSKGDAVRYVAGIPKE